MNKQNSIQQKQSIYEEKENTFEKKFSCTYNLHVNFQGF